MNEQNHTPITAPTKPLHQLTTVPLTEEAKEVIARHGCKTDKQPSECTVHFPKGTTYTEILPRTMNARYKIKLPDGYVLHEVYDRYREISLLLYTPE